MNYTKPSAVRLLNMLEQKIIVFDGAMGTMIQQQGLGEDDFRGSSFLDHPSPLKGNNDLLSITRPDVIEQIHLEFLESGANIIGTNTFNANGISQADYNLETSVADINRAAVEIARKAVANFQSGKSAEEIQSDHPIFVAGSIGPTNRTCSMSPDVNNPAYRAVTFDQIAEAYREQAVALIESGVDILLLETSFDTLNMKAGIYALESYFEEEVKVDALESTTNELIVKLELLKDTGQLNISKETLKNFKSVLSTADLVKFAKSAPGSKTAILDKQLLETVLVDTKEAMPKPTEEELLKNEEYRKKTEKEKKRKLLFKIAKILSLMTFVSLLASISVFGWQEVKDNLLGNSTKEFLQKEDWVESSYGAFPIKISSPDVLKRSDSKIGQLFSFQSLEDPFSLSISTRPINKDDDIQSILMEKIKSNGALNILTQQEEFTLNNGTSTTRYYGSFDYLNMEEISVKKEYSSLSFFENGGTQTLNIIVDRDNKYAKQIRTRIENSIDFNKK